jgi:Protein of unknown function (DUF3153)
MWRFPPAWPLDRSRFSPWLPASITTLIRPFRAAIVALLALSLCGCVNYDVGFNVRGQSGGEFTQVIRLGTGADSNSGDSLGNWIASLEQRTKALDGRVRRRSDQSLELTIPFRNSKDLDRKFNQFFDPEAAPAKTQLTQSLRAKPSLPSISAHLDLTEQNYLLFLHDRFQLDLDLRPLSLIATTDQSSSQTIDTTLINPGSLLDLTLQLTTPWGSNPAPNSLRPTVTGSQLQWQLQPGKLNHLEASYWMPSPIGWGALVVIGLVALTSWLRDRLTTLVDPSTLVESD